MQSLAGKSALVVGGAGGIGSVVTRRLTALGLRVAIAGRSEERLLQFAAGFPAGQRPATFVADVSSAVEVERLIGGVTNALGSLDLVVSLVGAHYLAPVENVPPEEWDRVMATKPRAAFLLAHYAVPIMTRQGSGTLVFFTSGGAHSGTANFTAFCAAEHAVRGFVAALAKEVEPKGLRVAHVMPVGTVQLERRSRFNRGDPATWIDPSDLADAVVFVASQSGRGRTNEIAVHAPTPVNE